MVDRVGEPPPLTKHREEKAGLSFCTARARFAEGSGTPSVIRLVGRRSRMERITIGSSLLEGEARAREFARIEAAIDTCRLCPEAGYPTLTGPIRRGGVDAPILIVGQAPGRLERERELPFCGPAGQRLMAWMRQAGFIGVDGPPTEEAFRSQTYFSAITKCYPGPGVKGDRRPSPREAALCRPFLAGPLALLQPRLVILIGGMAIDAFLGKRPLEETVGAIFERDGRPWVPLPHPSGASLWLNHPAHRARLDQALAHLSRLREELGLLGSSPRRHGGH
jgi:uracil-DNA glycosylase